MSIKTIAPRIAAMAHSRVKPAPKRADPLYSTPEYLAWREQVIVRAGRRCEAIDNGQRCTKAEPYNRMFADHIVEVRDDGARFDIANGQCLCGAHHTLKTVAERAKRATS